MFSSDRSGLGDLPCAEFQDPHKYPKVSCLLLNKLYEWLLQWQLLLCNIPCCDCSWIYFSNNLLSGALDCTQLRCCIRCRLLMELLRKILKILEMSMMLKRQYWKISEIPLRQTWHWQTLLSSPCRPGLPWRTQHRPPQTQRSLDNSFTWLWPFQYTTPLLEITINAVFQPPHKCKPSWREQK